MTGLDTESGKHLSPRYIQSLWARRSPLVKRLGVPAPA